MSAQASLQTSGQPDLFREPPASSPVVAEFSYDEILEKAREAIDSDYEPSTDHAVGQMHAEIAEAFGDAEFAGPVFEAEPEGLQPRISIHLFCELGETAALGEQVMKDRRLARASGAIFTGGLPAAILRYRAQTTPSLVIVEAGDDDLALLLDLDRLAEVCDGATKVMVIGRRNDIALYRELVRRGVSDYLVAPLDPLTLIGAVGALYEDPSAPFAGRAVAVVGAKGGVGASILAHNLAHSLSERMDSSTVLVDLDLAFGAAGLNFNQDRCRAWQRPGRSRAPGLRAARPDDGALHRPPQPVRRPVQPRRRLRPRRAGLCRGHAQGEGRRALRGAGPAASVSGWMRQTLLSADEAVVVATPDLTSLRNTKNLIELLTQGRPNDGPPRLVLNQVGVPAARKSRPKTSARPWAFSLRWSCRSSPSSTDRRPTTARCWASSTPGPRRPKPSPASPAPSPARRPPPGPWPGPPCSPACSS
ncbi:MAG: hypothetical protein WDN45_14930 [Caulobacteraceae bacterium]